MVYYFGLSDDSLIFHWPLPKVHDSEYCQMFVRYARSQTRGKEMDIRKCDYLLTYSKNRDKSEFLKKIGYEKSNPEKLKLDILYGTDFKTLSFSRYDQGCLSCVAKTTLKGKIVTTTWELMRNLKVRFITLIPGGDKRWK